MPIFFIILLIGFASLPAFAQKTLVLNPKTEILDLSAAIYPPEASTKLETFKDYQVNLKLINNSEAEEYYLYLGYWTDIRLSYVSQDTQERVLLHTGHFVPLPDRPYQASPKLFLPVNLKKGAEIRLQLRLRQEMRFYLSRQIEAKLYSKTALAQEEQQRLWYQGIFWGIILVMALYNLLIYIAVRDISFLYYVLSILGVGAYFLFYYGFLLEFLWGDYPRWNALSFAFIVPLTRIAWVLFTKSYLNLAQILPLWHRRINWLIVLYIPPMLLGVWTLVTGQDLSLLITNWIGFMGVLVLSSMIILGFWVWQKGYRPAKYFLLASVAFSFGSIIFIFREIGYLPDTNFTRYGGQIGIMAQATLFSLGLAYRLNTTRQELSEKEIEREKLLREQEQERQKLIEEQKKLLEAEVAERTADLKQAVSQLQSSEQNLRELNALKDRLFSIIAHDTRSPLATLSSFLNILIHFAEDTEPEDLRRLAEKTQQSVENLSQLLDNLLQWAMSQMKRTRFNPQLIDLEEEVSSVISLLEPSAKQKQIRLVLAENLNYRVLADRQMLAFILRNLLSNAIKFSPQGGSIYLSTTILPHQNLEIAIRDEGLGISPEAQLKIFHPTEAFSTPGTQQEKGVGLGLLLCKEFVEMHESHLALSSFIGKGSRFSFTLKTAL